MNHLESLVEISHYYGNNPSYVIAGGGNTSYKDREKLWIKASGVSLADIGTDGFVSLSRELLGLMEDKIYKEDSGLREEQVKNDLKKAIVSQEHLRPSVETSLHNLIDYSYIIHTHPTVVNAMMCAKNAQKEVEERFGSEALYVEYTDPGYILFKKLQAQIRTYKMNFGHAPKIIFLQNHGIFVGANSAREIKAIYDSIESRIRMHKTLVLPGIDVEEYRSEASDEITRYFSGNNLKSNAFRSELINHFTSSKALYQKISRPFTPDIIVYCKSNYLFLEQGLDGKQIISRIKQFELLHGYYPKVILEEQEGLIIVEEGDRSIQIVLEVFTDMMKISYLSENFGGPHFMTEDKISFIDNWEVENYRRKVAKL
ncbi:MAG: class II aldolase [Bacteroidales bacterium]|nr:class II aldolase [Bacteroidales bacterium]